MPASATITMTVTFSVELPKKWVKEETYEDELQNCLVVDVRSTNGRVKIDHDSIETEIEVELDDIMGLEE